MRNSGKRDSNGESIGSPAKGNLDDDVDALFKVPLSEFIGARNGLAARLKREGRANDANLVKALSKPSISAWAVNQLYWKHREAFDQLRATSQRLRQAQTSRSAGKITNLRGSLDARREALSHLSDIATELLREGGHNPTPDTIHRITTTLEAVSAYASLSDGPTPGRLTQDVDPPGFDSLASFMVGASTMGVNEKLTKVTPPPKSASTIPKTQKISPPRDVQKERQLEDTRRERIATAKLSLQEAKRSLTEARTRAQRLEADKKKAYAEAKEADADARQAKKQLREAEERFTKASATSEDAVQRAQRIAGEIAEAAQAVEDAKRSIDESTRELESLFRESTAT